MRKMIETIVCCTAYTIGWIRGFINGFIDGVKHGIEQYRS